MNTKSVIEIEKPRFDKSRLRVYYGNMGEIIAQEVLQEQGFEVSSTRPVGNRQSFLRIFRVPKIGERLEELRRYYDSLPSFRKEEETWERFRERHKERVEREIDGVKAIRAFFGDELEAFISYLKKIKLSVVGERMYLPDLIAKKNGKIYIIEVKSTKSAQTFLKGKRLRGLLLAREYGFIPSIVSFNLRIEAKGFTMKEID